MAAVYVLAVCLGVATLAGGCSGKESRDALGTTPVASGPDADPRVLASVEGEAVTVSWFEQTYIDLLVRSGANDTPGNRWAHLDFLIDSILLAGAFDAAEASRSTDFRRFVARVEQEELGSRFFETGLIDTMSAPTDGQIRQAFRRSREKAVVRHLFFTSRADAEASWGRLEAGTSFLEEARRVYGLSEVDSLAGYLGAIGYYSMDDAFAEAAWELSPGSWSRPVRTRFGWHIILLDQLVTSPLLTESQYQTARPGISSQYRLRRRRLEGDTFVRRFMEARGVEVNAAAIVALSDLVGQLDPAPDDPTGTAQALESETLAAEIDENVVLATYEWEGDRTAFTAGEYAFWLESLPQREARERTAASVGRALRNDLLARAASEQGLRDAEWETEVRRRVVLESATRMRRGLREDTSEIDTMLVRKAYERLGLAARTLRTATFQAATFASRRQAEAALARGVTWTESYTDERLEDIPEWNPWAWTLPLGQPTVVGRKEDWAVIRVSNRNAKPVSWDRHRDELTRELAPRVREFEAVRALRKDANIRVDTTLFFEIQPPLPP